MNISVVIPVSDDLRLKRCVDSIDEKVEVVVSFNKPSEEIRSLVRSMLKSQENGKKYKEIKFVVCEIEKPSIAGAYNNGIKYSSYDRIFLMDSDCIFKKGCIKKLEKNLKNGFLSKGKVIFTTNSWISKIIAKAREYHTSDKISAYSPPLLFSKKIIDYIGSYYFHPSLYWLEDSEFDKRVNKARLKIAYDPTANVYHPPLSPASDLKSAFCYGVGKRIGVELGIHDKPTGLIGSFNKYLIGASKEKGVLVGIYLFIWKTSLLMGYYTQFIFKLRK